MSLSSNSKETVEQDARQAARVEEAFRYRHFQLEVVAQRRKENHRGRHEIRLSNRFHHIESLFRYDSCLFNREVN